MIFEPFVQVAANVAKIIIIRGQVGRWPFRRLKELSSRSQMSVSNLLKPSKTTSNTSPSVILKESDLYIT